jgi:3'-phosphoadenosine 5'-phosphosulfate sulfotransferase (PAPS reductase)/FAD synthetase
MDGAAIRHLVMYSGGACSWAAARRTIERHGRDGVALLFADTLIEDEDLYRFLEDSTANLGVPLVRIADGRTPWEVFEERKFIGNTRVDLCSRILKRELMNRWRDDHCRPGETTIVYGLDWQERHRIEGHIEKGERKPGHRERLAAEGWHAVYPMDERPYLTQDDILGLMRAEGLEPPRLYALGFPHNNCGGFCCKMGLAQARHLLQTMPGRYAEHERREREVMAAIGPTARPFLRDRRGGRTRGVTMQEFRERLEREPELFADHGWGCGGGCAVDD